MERRTVTVTVYQANKFDDDFPEDENYGLGLAEFVGWAKAHLASIPEEFRGNARIVVDSESGYEGSHYATITIAYERPETDEEMARREAMTVAVKHAQQSRERAEYERLRAKFGP